MANATINRSRPNPTLGATSGFPSVSNATISAAGNHFEKDFKIRSPRIPGALVLSATRQQTLPIPRRAFEELCDRLARPWDHEAVEAADGLHLFVRVPADEPDAVADLERAAEELPDWAQASLSAVYLVGASRTVHVPGYTAVPLLAERARADALQADGARRSLGSECDALVYRSDGDPLGLLRLAVRVPTPRVADLGDPELDAIAHVAGPYLEDGRAERVQAVLLVADGDHLRIRVSDFFEDVEERWAGSRRRAPRRDPPRKPAAAPGPVAASFGGFPSPRHTLRPIGPPRRRVETVEPVAEIETEVQAAPDGAGPADRGPATERASRLLARVDEKRLELGRALAVRLLRLHGFRVLEDVYHGRTRYVAAGERDSGSPRRVAVRVMGRVGRRDLDQMLVEARALGADLLLAIAPDAPAALARRAQGTRVRLVRPEDVADLKL